jgi:hypothetical protein
MPAHDTRLEQSEYRLALVRFGSQTVWVDCTNGALRLPRVTIPRWVRPAGQLQMAIEAGWHLRIIILDFLPSKVDSAPCAVVEIMSSEAPDGLASASIDEIFEEDMAMDEREAIRAILADSGSARGPFSRVGWIQDAITWMRAEVGQDVQFTEDIHQLNASATFALIRFATETGPAFWLKATGEPNLHEFDITKTLTAICPEYLPRLVTMRRDWNAWVMEDAGEPLGQHACVSLLEKAVVSMANLQKNTLGRTEQLLTAGATDQRIPVLRGDVDEIISYLEEAMERQTSTKVPRLRASQLREIGAILIDAMGAMEELGIPDTVIHNDINRGNILFSDRGCVFTDWSEACIGNPFVTCHHLLMLLASDGENPEADRAALKQAYQQTWGDCLDPKQFDQAFALMPLLAVASHLYGRGEWLRSSRQYDPHFLSHARTLARHMDRAARSPLLLGALCHEA